MDNLNEFNRKIDEHYAREVIPKFIEFHKTVALKAYQLVIRDSRDVGLQYGSPVWTGRFRASNRISIGQADKSVKPEHPDAAFLSWPDEPDTPIKPDGIAYARNRLSGLKAFDVIYISNSLPYARQIEAGGYSLKAPAGVYQVAANQLRVELQGKRLIGVLT